LQNILGPSIRGIAPDQAAELRAFIQTTTTSLLARNAEQPARERARTMSSAIWCLARLHFRPESSMMAAVCDAAVATVASNTPQGTANMLLGLALLEVTPQEESGLVEVLVLRARQQVWQCDLKSIAVCCATAIPLLHKKYVRV
jgi:hypothetical protein